MGVQVFREITVDFSNSRYIIINAKQHDSKSRFVRMTCTSVGQKVNLNPTDYSAFIRYKKSDGYGVFNKCIISTEGQIIFELTEQMLSTVGTSYADLVVIDVAKSDINDDLTIISADGRIIENNGSLVSTMTFYINVLEKPLNDWDIESTNEFSALNDLLLKASKDYEYIVQTTKGYMDNAKTSADNAKISETNSKQSEINSKVSENNAKTSADNAENHALLARSYTIGDTNTRPNEAENNSRFFYEQLMNMFNNISETLRPKGTILFSELSSQIKKSGYMYNISNDFISDDTFKDGAGRFYSAGTNVYYTIDGYWDCLSGSFADDKVIKTMQNNIDILNKRVGELKNLINEIIEICDITIVSEIIDNMGNKIVTNNDESIVINEVW